MRTEQYRDEEDRLVSFSIANHFISSRSMARFFGRCPEVEVTRVRRMFSLNDHVHVEFTLRGEPFQVEEPYGDSSELLIAPLDISTPSTAIEQLHEWVRATPHGIISRAWAWLAEATTTSLR